MRMWKRSGHRMLGALAAIVFFLATINVVNALSKETDEMSQLAKVSGTVTAPTEFKAARVYFRNPDRRMLYMVYTNAGKYQAMNLMPGKYEVFVQGNRLESDVQNIELKAGDSATVNVSLRPGINKSGSITTLSYDEIYPKGEGRKIAERTCIACHGPSFIPSHQWDADQWNAGIDIMMAGDAPPIPATALPKDQRDIFVKYLVDNFGPSSERHAVDQSGMVVDDAKLSKAEYIEFYFPPDPPGVDNNDPKYHGLRKQPFGNRRVGQDVVLDPQGYAWASDRGTPQRIARLDPRTAEWKSFLLPNPTKGIHDLFMDSDGMILIPEWMGPSNVNIFDTKALQWVGSYPMDPEHLVGTGETHTLAIVADSNHNIYADFNLGSAISKIDAKTKKATVTLFPNRRSFPYGVVKDTKDNIFVSEFRGGKIARIDAKTQKLTEYTPLTYPAYIRRLSVDWQDKVWYGLFSAGIIGRIDPVSGKVSEWHIPIAGSQPYSVKVASTSNKIWVSDGGGGGALVSFDPSNEDFTIFPTPQATDQPLLRMAKDGAVWYCPRSAKNGGIGVLYPDMTKVSSLAPYPTDKRPNY
jgi:streptogramin lyase